LFEVRKIDMNFAQIVIEGDREAVALNPDPVKKLLLVELNRPVHVTICLLQFIAGGLEAASPAHLCSRRSDGADDLGVAIGSRSQPGLG
jgi:hypothetical protein